MHIYIIEDHLKPLLLKTLFKNQNYLFDYKIMSLDEFISESLDYESLNYFELYLTLDKLELTTFKSNIKEIDFLKELINNRYLCDAYQIDPNTLNIHQEYKILLNHVPSLDLKALDNSLNQDFSHYTIVDTYYPLYKSQIISRMLKCGAKTFKFPSALEHHDYQVVVQNERQGIDMIARYIIEHNLKLEDVAIIANSNSFNFIKTHLKRYNLEIDTNIKFQNAYIARQLVAIMDFYLKPDNDHYLKMVSLNTLGQYDTLSFKTFITNHLEEFENKLSNRMTNESAYYQELEQNYNAIHSIYLPFINELLDLNFEDAIIYAFDRIKAYNDETKAIKRIIEKYQGYIKEAYAFYRDELLNLKLSHNTSGILLSTYQKDLYQKAYIFVLDPNINNYPGFMTLSGILNEHNLSHSNYPDLELRFNHHHSLFNYLKQSHTTFYVLCKSTLAGKTVEYDDHFKTYPVYQVDIDELNRTQLFTYDHKLSKAVAAKTFIKNHTIKGSVSSFEKYFNCPYAYFLNYGLKLYEPQTMELNAATTGTIIHAIFEELTNRYHKEYYKADEKVIDNILKKYQDQLNHLYPKLKGEISATMKRIKASVLLEMVFIESMEKDTYFSVDKAEHRFEYEIIKDEDCRILLRGIIDRVDQFGPYFRIIDYKTSDHSLNKEKVAKGLQLQLLTYALIYAELSKLSPVGVFYLNVKHSKIDGDEYKYSKRGGLELNAIDEAYLYNKFMTAHKLSGLVFEDVEGLDLEYKHLKSQRKGALSSRYMIDYDKTKALLNEIYHFLLSELKHGNIALTPSKSACEFCDYHRICHFKGLQGLNDKMISSINIGVTNETE